MDIVNGSSTFAAKQEEARLMLKALKFLDKYKILGGFEETANRHFEKYRSTAEDGKVPLILELELDLILLFQHSQKLCMKIIADPVKFQRLFQELIEKEMNVLLCARNIRPPIRTHVILRCTEFPGLANTKLAKYEANKNALSLLRGYVLISKATPVPYSICSLYRCSDRNCVYGYSGIYVTEEDLRTTKNTCSFCYKQRKEDPVSRGYGERVMANFIESTALKHNEGAVRYQSVMCSVTAMPNSDSLTNGLELGVEYNVWGRHTNRWFEVWGMERLVRVPFEKRLSLLPPKIQALRDILDTECPKSHWAFVSSLASQLGCGEWPAKSFMHLKMGLLLSLATLAGGLPVPIMCSGPDTYAAGSLMNYAAKLAARHMPVSFPVNGFAKKDTNDNSMWLESGVLTMTRTGVCTVGNWECLKPAQSNAILSTLEKGVITMDTKNVAATGPMLTCPPLPLRASVWTFWGYNGLNRQTTLLKNLTNIFGVPFLADSNNDNPCIAYRLKLATADGPSLKRKDLQRSVPVPEVITFLRIVNSITVVMNEKASQLLKNYFVACRRARGDCMPVNSISTMAALAEGHARLSLRTEVTYEDVVAVIRLYEESLCHNYRDLVNGSAPFTLCATTKIDETMHSFEKWLKKYISSLVDL